jgi:hypothetical protein
MEAHGQILWFTIIGSGSDAITGAAGLAHPVRPFLVFPEQPFLADPEPPIRIKQVRIGQ